ncbi:protein translocase subunit SecD [Novibacillus thermophilus]|jgi:protein-export SecD/SecF family membrane protein|uniref:Protein translocase subunit SecD n=1 Tax=Novibacillus thermophilus TaxID=1471761 RepID=A0A1U9K5C5_9BACL|nr:protein translocase subunit SecD [Novibacillus thermophilus]AQS55222.1 protein-export membrane protein SecD [Novibacillus thermophilus]
MIRWSRILVFVILVAAVFATIAWTAEDVVNNITLGLDLQGGFEVLYEAKPLNEGQQITQETLAAAAAAVRQRIDVLGVEEPNVAIEGENRIRVQLAGVEDQDEARRILGTPAHLTFRLNHEEVLLTGEDLKENGASVQFDPDTNEPVVALKLKDAEKFAAITRDHMGEILAIYLDEEVVSAPSINAVIPNGEAVIQGNMSVDEAQELADLLNAGALPVNLEEIQSFSIAASLGELSLIQSLKAGVYGSLIVLLFMIGYYRVPGMIAAISLVAYAYLVLLTFSLLNVTLTLAGIAAFILGIGMAVDANILMYERIKEEIRSGKTIPSSVKAGSRRSFLTIFDANITTVVAAAVLFYFGTANIKGFAVSLIVSILVSFLTAVAGSRLLMNLLLKSRVLKNPSWFGVKGEEIGEL